MDVDRSIVWLIAVVLLSIEAVITAGHTALTHLRRSRLKQLQDAQQPAAHLAADLLDHPDRLHAALYSARALLYAAIAVLVTPVLYPELARLLAGVPWLAGASAWLAIIILILLIGLAVFLFGEWLPMQVGRRYPEPLALALARPLALVRLLFWPAGLLAYGLGSLLRGLIGAEDEEPQPQIEEEIKTLVDAYEEEGVIEEDEKEMIYSIFELGDTLVREVMVPRIDIVAVEAGTPLLEALDIIMQAGHSRIPVYKGTIDNIIGVLYVKDLLPYLKRGETDVPLESIVREPYFIPETKKVDQLLPDLQQRKVHMAIVVDEYGGTAGLVTIEDLLEEIVGEIQDEYDREEPMYQQVSENEFILDARINLDDFAELVGVEIADEGSDTLGGFIYNQLGRVPAVGDTISYDGITITVLSLIGRRIGKVRVVRQEAAPAADEGETQAGRIPSPTKDNSREH